MYIDTVSYYIGIYIIYINPILRRVQDLNLRAGYKAGSPDFESGALPLCQLSMRHYLNIHLNSSKCNSHNEFLNISSNSKYRIVLCYHVRVNRLILLKMPSQQLLHQDPRQAGWLLQSYHPLPANHRLLVLVDLA